MEALWPVLAESYSQFYDQSFDDQQRSLQHNESVYHRLMKENPEKIFITPLSQLLMEHLQCDQTLEQVKASDEKKAELFERYKNSLEQEINVRKEYKEMITPSASLRAFHPDFTEEDWTLWTLKKCCNEQQIYAFQQEYSEISLENLIMYVPRLGEPEALKKMFFIMEVIQRSSSTLENVD